MDTQIKKILSLVTVFILIFSLSGCGEAKLAEICVNRTLSAIKARDFDTASKYLNTDKIGKISDRLGDDKKEILNALLNNFDYKILSSKKNPDGTVTVKTSITATNMKPIMKDYISTVLKETMKNAASADKLTDEELKKKTSDYFIESLSKSGLETVTNEVDVTASNDGSKQWLVKSDSALTNAILGGLFDAMKDSDSLFN